MLSKAFITDLVALFPGRLARAFEISIVSTLAVIVSMTFEIPSPDVSAYVIFGLLRAKESGFVVRDDALALEILAQLLDVVRGDRCHRQRAPTRKEPSVDRVLGVGGSAHRPALALDAGHVPFEVALGHICEGVGPL